MKKLSKSDKSYQVESSLPKNEEANLKVKKNVVILIENSPVLSVYEKRTPLSFIILMVFRGKTELRRCLRDFFSKTFLYLLVIIINEKPTYIIFRLFFKNSRFTSSRNKRQFWLDQFICCFAR